MISACRRREVLTLIAFIVIVSPPILGGEGFHLLNTVKRESKLNISGILQDRVRNISMFQDRRLSIFNTVGKTITTMGKGEGLTPPETDLLPTFLTELEALKPEENVVNTNEANIAMQVVPTLWVRGWAITLYTLLVVGLVMILIKLREGRLLKSQVKELEIARRNVLEANRKLEFLTMNDSLTELLNRRGFAQAITQAMTTAHRNDLMVTVFMIDVDSFKLYNDNYGHIQGDEVLRRMGKALRSVFGRSTDIITRFGGEEFAVVFIGRDPGASVILANNLIVAVQNLRIKHEFSTVSDCLTLSAGIATVPTKMGTTEEGLLVHADEALYNAKLAGRNRFCFTGIIPPLPDQMANGIAPMVGDNIV